MKIYHESVHKVFNQYGDHWAVGASVDGLDGTSNLSYTTSDGHKLVDFEANNEMLEGLIAAIQRRLEDAKREESEQK